ncbi:MAG: cell division protein FtsA, partial [Acidipila sp.]|nr:cell division protein FtsA [Acidipila sp.]
MSKKDRYIVGIDIGSTKTCVLIGQLPPEPAGAGNGDAPAETIEFLGVGVADSKGIRRGLIVNLDAARAAL